MRINFIFLNVSIAFFTVFGCTAKKNSSDSKSINQFIPSLFDHSERKAKEEISKIKTEIQSQDPKVELTKEEVASLNNEGLLDKEEKAELESLIQK